MEGSLLEQDKKRFCGNPHWEPIFTSGFQTDFEPRRSLAVPEKKAVTVST